MTQSSRFAIGLIVVLSSLVLTVSAQVDTGAITGRVTDPSGAGIPNVQVSLVQTQTNFRFSAATNSEGIYRVQSLPPGPYRLTFEASGFKRLVREEISVRVGDVLPVDALLEVGSITESLTGASPARRMNFPSARVGTS